jgi:ubiquinone/menaquinone biosynthesis C-methylase UbiE
MKERIKKLLPARLVENLQRLKLYLDLSKSYTKASFSFADIPVPRLKSSYANKVEKESAPSKRIMKKLKSYVGAGPIGPNKYWEYPWVISHLNLKPGLKVLDAGCGRAPIQYLLADLGLEVVGIDPFEDVGWHGIDKRLSKKYGVNINYRVEGMEKISFPDESFDRVLSVSVIEHCRAQYVIDELATPQTRADRTLQAKMMREMARVLKPGGLLVVTLDVMFPERGAVLECNVNVMNLIQASGLELLGPEIPAGYYGHPDFYINNLKQMKDLDIQDYTGVRGTSLGLIFKK